MCNIEEADLTDFIKNNAVKELNIIFTDTAKYRITVSLNWKEGLWNLVTARGKTREWASLDRLCKHIREKYDGSLPPITLKLTEHQQLHKEKKK